MDLGLADEEAWGLTPRWILLLHERWREREQAQRQAADRRAGEVAAMMANLKRDPKKAPKPWTWMDIFPEHLPPSKDQTEDEMLMAFEVWARVGSASG